MSWDEKAFNEKKLFDKAMSMNRPLRSLKNLGTFSTTYMDEKATKIFNDFALLNAVDSCAYPELIDMEQFCGNFLLDLYHAQNHQDFNYFTTSGSSEALFMSLLFMKNYWKLRNQGNHQKPNFIIGTNGHTAWHKAATYLDVELKLVPVDLHKLNLNENALFNYIDNNTIGVGCTLGATTTLVYDEVERINIALNDYRNKKNIFIPIHVDAASGGFIAPFMQSELTWDFRLNHVMSINVSSHKFGQIYPSLGWLCVRSEISADELAHESHYLGKAIKRYPIQFSHSASHLATQAYYVKTLGKSGYASLIKQLFDYKTKLAEILSTFEEISIVSPTERQGLPGLIFTFSEKQNTHNLAGLASYLTLSGWHLPTFRLPAPKQDILASRIIIRNGFNEKLMEELRSDIGKYLISTPE